MIMHIIRIIFFFLCGFSLGQSAQNINIEDLFERLDRPTIEISSTLTMNQIDRAFFPGQESPIHRHFKNEQIQSTKNHIKNFLQNIIDVERVHWSHYFTTHFFIIFTICVVANTYAIINYELHNSAYFAPFNPVAGGTLVTSITAITLFLSQWLHQIFLSKEYRMYVHWKNILNEDHLKIEYATDILAKFYVKNKWTASKKQIEKKLKEGFLSTENFIKLYKHYLKKINPNEEILLTVIQG
ncbi:MAG: hypothetical protein HEEMFOPI_02044 [Holosporales bacterium]